MSNNQVLWLSYHINKTYISGESHWTIEKGSSWNKIIPFSILYVIVAGTLKK
jgi:hypothetical protein